MMDEEFKKDLKESCNRLQKIINILEQTSDFKDKLKAFVKFKNEIEKNVEETLTPIVDGFERLEAYVDELKAQRDKAMGQNIQLMALLTRTKAVEKHPGFTQVTQESQNDIELQSLKETVAAMQKQMSEKNE